MSVNNDQAHLDASIARVTGMLTAKREIWTANSPLFENFDIQRDLGVDPTQFGLQMCLLKMSRLKKRFGQYRYNLSPSHGFSADPDAEDSLVDLASYALLTLALVYREKARVEAYEEEEPDDLQPGQPTSEAGIDACIQAPGGKAEIAKLAEEMMYYDPLTNRVRPLEERDAI